LADLWEDNNCPDILKQIRSAGDLSVWYPNPPDDDCPIGGWYREVYPAKLKKALRLGVRNKDEERKFKEAVLNLSTITLTPEQAKAKELRELLKQVHTYNIPGFFPTPDELIDKMLDYADIFGEDPLTILEPSAGIGNIVDRISEKAPRHLITCCELSPSLAHILMIKGYEVRSNDIYDLVKVHAFNRIIMNPPFENGQDIDHVMFCFDKFLKYGGKLVSIMSSGSITRTDKKGLAFKEFREKHHAYWDDNGQAFKGAFNSTGVSTITLIIEK